MQDFIQILTQTDANSIILFEKQRLELTISDPMEREFQSWKAPWREESLRHYLATGWSIGKWQSDKKEILEGYFLGQVLLFYQGLTQVLWVEHVSSQDSGVIKFLEETAIRYAKDNHLQAVIFYSENDLRKINTTTR